MNHSPKFIMRALSLLHRGSLRLPRVFKGGEEQARELNLLEDWGREWWTRGDLWEGLIYFTLRCQLNGGSKSTGDGKFLKILINGGWGFSEKFNLAKQGSHNTTGRAFCGIRFLARNCSLRIYCFCFGLWFIIGLEKLINRGVLLNSRVGRYRKINKWGGGGGGGRRLFGT